MSTGYGYNILCSINNYSDKLDNEDKRKIKNALKNHSNFSELDTLVDKTLDGKDTPDSLSILPVDKNSKGLIKDQVIKELDRGNTIIAGDKEQINKIIDNI